MLRFLCADLQPMDGHFPKSSVTSHHIPGIPSPSSTHIAGILLHDHLIFLSLSIAVVSDTDWIFNVTVAPHSRLEVVTTSFLLSTTVSRFMSTYFPSFSGLS